MEESDIDTGIHIHVEDDEDAWLGWRREVILNVFGEEPSARLMADNREYYRTHHADGRYVAVTAAIADGQGVGCGSICLTEELPSPDNPDGRCAYLMNIYVRRPFRKRGIGTAIVRFLVDKALELRCEKIYLESTDMAVNLYEDIGFRPMSGMMKLKR